MWLGVFVVKIIEGTHQVDGINGNVYLVEDGDKLILIDTGLPRNEKKILKYIESLGRKPEDVSTIVITHFHIDHIGSLKKSKKQPTPKWQFTSLTQIMLQAKKLRQNQRI
jgi:glyoxylase-like metal-dependent hydrolase (beta-lactamase superfamily II)